MSGDVSARTAAALAAVKHRNALRGLLALAGAVVLALTAWALVLPGVTMANATFCGQQEHEHSGACYQEVLACGFGEDAEAADDSAADIDAASDSAGAAEPGAADIGSSSSDGADARFPLLKLRLMAMLLFPPMTTQRSLLPMSPMS